MFELNSIRKIIHILMGSKFYLNMSLRERHDLIRLIRTNFPYPV